MCVTADSAIIMPQSLTSLKEAVKRDTKRSNLVCVTNSLTMAASVIDFDGALAYEARRPHSLWRNRPRRESFIVQKRQPLTHHLSRSNAILSLPGIFSWRDLLLNSFMAMCCARSTYNSKQPTKDKRGSH